MHEFPFGWYAVSIFASAAIAFMLSSLVNAAQGVSTTVRQPLSFLRRVLTTFGLFRDPAYEQRAAMRTADDLLGQGYVIPHGYLIKTTDNLILTPGAYCVSDQVREVLELIPDCFAFTPPNQRHPKSILTVWEPDVEKAALKFRTRPAADVLVPVDRIQEKIRQALTAKPDASVADLNFEVAKICDIVFREPFPEEHKVQKTWYEQQKERLTETIHGAKELQVEISRLRADAEEQPEPTRQFLLDLIDHLEAELKQRLASR